MHIGTFVFAQIVQFLPQRQFRRILAKYNDRTKGWSMSHWNHLLVLMFGQLMGCGSLRELTDITTAHAKKSKHLGFGHQPINRQMLSKANTLREHRIFEEFAFYMVAMAQARRITKEFELHGRFYAIDSTNYEEDVEKALLGLGFVREDFNRQTSDFSGGWRMRIELAKLLLQKPDVLLLDEPTNHLDIESIQWLEDFLISNGKAVIVISHDRKFVDNITTRTIEVTMGRIYDYKVNYSKYLELRKERREQQQKAYDDQQKFIAETKEFIERFKGTYSKTLQVQSRVKMLEKLELLEVDEEDTSALRLKFPPSPRSGNYPVIMEGVGKSYGDHVVFKNANLTIERGDKVAFVGANEQAITTFFKIKYFF